MKEEIDYERSRAKVLGLDQTLERPWVLLENTERVEYENMPPLPDQALAMVLGARRARPLAESYRGFSVGACAMVRRGGSAIAFGHGVNMKNAAGESAVDLHAEEAILRSLRPGDELTTLAIVGPAQEDRGSGREAPTLHPCTYRCLPLLSESEFVSRDTLIICNTPDGTQLEWGTVTDFQRYHDGDPSGVVSVSFEAFPAVLRPVPKAETFKLSELDIDTTEWDAKVTFPLAEKGILFKAREKGAKTPSK